MPKYNFTTNDGSGPETTDEPLALPNDNSAADEAQNALVDMAREHLPDGSVADFDAAVADEQGKEIYTASLRLRASKRPD